MKGISPDTMKEDGRVIEYPPRGPLASVIPERTIPCTINLSGLTFVLRGTFLEKIFR